jgi:uncharacterized membrane protein
MGYVIPRNDAKKSDRDDGPPLELRWPASAIWRPGEAAVRKITIADLRVALALGIEDFKAAPSHLIFTVLFYPIIGLVLGRLLLGGDLLSLLFPIVAGLALLGPIVAIGLYEVSRRRERGLPTTLWNANDVWKSQSLGALSVLTLIVFALFFAWVAVAQNLYKALMGSWQPVSVQDLITHITTTPAGLQLMTVGNLLGFLFAATVLVISAVSFPMLIDRNVSAGTAVRASVRAFVANPVTMPLWGLFVAISLTLGAIPFGLGLAVVLPILGHATWHLYRKVVV